MNETLRRMFKIEYDCELENLNDIGLQYYINPFDKEISFKNYNENIDLVYLMNCYFDVENYEYIQQFKYLYDFNECEIINFEINMDY